jgi:hypothetical protein
MRLLQVFGAGGQPLLALQAFPNTNFHGCTENHEILDPGEGGYRLNQLGVGGG